MKFASDVSPLCTELTSALDNPIWGWRLRSKHRFSKFFVELESDVNLAEDAGMVAIDHCVDMGLTFGGVDKPAEEGLMAKSIRKLFLPDDSM